MRSNFLTSDMDFRVIPSAIPLQSPSPDRKCINLIAPTVSPNAMEIKRGLTPPKFPYKSQKQTMKNIQDYDTQIKNEKSSEKLMQSSAIKEKDEIIKNLRNVIDMITDNNRHKRNNEEDVMQLKNEIKILTIQNQKMVNIIDKFQKSKSNTEDKLQKEKIQEYESRLTELNKTIKQNEHFHQEEMKELKRFNKSLNTQLKNIENQRKELEVQNTKLMKILKEKNQFEKTGTEKMKLSDTSEHSIEDKTQNFTLNKSNDRLTLVKIREQHSENLKVLRQGLVKQIQQTFQTMKQALHVINSKVTLLNNRLDSIQNRNLTKSHVSRQTITINIIQKEGEVNESQQIDRSFKIERKNNSQIYIEEALSSSHDKVSRDQFGQLEEVPSYKNLTSHLEQQLNTTKTELNQLRSKYEKICMDTGASFSHKNGVDDNDKEQIEYRQKQVLRQIEDKNEQIQSLRSRVRQMEIKYIERLKESQLLSQKFTNQIHAKREEYQKELEQIQEQTSEKVNMIIETYEKQIQIIQKERFSLSNQIEQLKQKLSQREENSPFILELNNIQDENSHLKREFENLGTQKELLEKQLMESENLKAQLEQEIQAFKVEVQKILAEKQEIQNQLLSSETMALKYEGEAAQLKVQVESKAQQLRQIRAQAQNQRKILIEQNSQLAQINLVNQVQIREYKEKIEDLSNPLEVIRQLERVYALSDLTQKDIKCLTQYANQIDHEYSVQIQSEIMKARIQNQKLYSEIQQIEEQKIRLQHRIGELESLISLKEQRLNSERQSNQLMVQRLNKLEVVLENRRKEKIQTNQKYGSIEERAKQICCQIDYIKQLEQRRAGKLSNSFSPDFAYPHIQMQ